MKNGSNKASTRRQFLRASLAIVTAAGLPLPAVAGRGKSESPEAQPTSAAQQTREALERRLAVDPLRPQFHLLPAANWMNDPNGPIYWKGSYHMFFQYNPHASVWGDMHWDHAVSPDMVHWTHLPVALAPTPGSFDAFGIFSGSCIAVGDRVAALYTGVVQSTPQEAMLRDGHSNLRESQCLAWSDSSDLIHWTKLPHPVIPAPPPGLDVTGFRDPSVWKQGEWYYLTVGSGIAKQGGCVLLYRSKDLEQWTYLHPLVQGVWNGKPAVNPCDSGEMWECPEFFPLDGSHVLIYSTEGKVFWQSGKLDESAMVFHPAKTGLLDLGAFYAPKTQLDAEGRRILWGWIQETRPEAQYAAAGWAGMMSLPRILRLDPDGTLRFEFVPRLNVLELPQHVPPMVRMEGIQLTVPRCCGRFSCTIPAGTEFELSVEIPGQQILKFTCSLDTGRAHADVDGKKIALFSVTPVQVEGYVDSSVVELLVNRTDAYTKRFYYEGSSPDITVRISGPHLLQAGGALSTAALQPISSNRLTTLAAEG